jgi:hypothetical protein
MSKTEPVSQREEPEREALAALGVQHERALELVCADLASDVPPGHIGEIRKDDVGRTAGRKDRVESPSTAGTSGWWRYSKTWEHRM